MKLVLSQWCASGVKPALTCTQWRKGNTTEFTARKLNRLIVFQKKEGAGSMKVSKWYNTNVYKLCILLHRVFWSIDPASQPSKPPTDRNIAYISLTTAELPSITKYLSTLSPAEIKRVGTELGLNIARLNQMNPESLLQDMVTAWLRGDDNVRETTWHSLIRALESVGHNGISASIRKGEYIEMEPSPLLKFG